MLWLWAKYDQIKWSEALMSFQRHESDIRISALTRFGIFAAVFCSSLASQLEVKPFSRAVRSWTMLRNLATNQLRCGWRQKYRGYSKMIQHDQLNCKTICKHWWVCFGIEGNVSKAIVNHPQFYHKMGGINHQHMDNITVFPKAIFSCADSDLEILQLLRHQTQPIVKGFPYKEAVNLLDKSAGRLKQHKTKWGHQNYLNMLRKSSWRECPFGGPKVGFV